jgi:hypothetical protein
VKKKSSGKSRYFAQLGKINPPSGFDDEQAYFTRKFTITVPKKIKRKIMKVCRTRLRDKQSCGFTKITSSVLVMKRGQDYQTDGWTVRLLFTSGA